MEAVRSATEWPTFLRQAPAATANGSFVSMSPRLGNYPGIARSPLPVRSPSKEDNMRMSSHGQRSASGSDNKVLSSSIVNHSKSIEELWDFVLRDQKERIQGHRDLQSQLRQQQDALNSIALKTEKSIDDFLRAELSNVQYECGAIARKVDTANENHATCSKRVDDLSQEVEKLCANCQCHETSLGELRELVTCKMDQENASVIEVREGLHSLKERTTAAIAEVQKFMRELRAQADDDQVRRVIELAAVDTDVECSAFGPGDQQNSVEQVDFDMLSADETNAAETACFVGADGSNNQENAEVLEPMDNDVLEPTSDEVVDPTGDDAIEPTSNDVCDPPETQCSILADEEEHNDTSKEDLQNDLKRMIEDRLQEYYAENAAQLTDVERRMSDEWTGLRGWVDAAVVAVVNRISSLECTLQNEMADRLTSTQLVADGAAQKGEQLKKMQADIDKLNFDMKVISVSNTFKKSLNKSAQTAPSASDDSGNSKPGAGSSSEGNSKPGVGNPPEGNSKPSNGNSSESAWEQLRTSNTERKNSNVGNSSEGTEGTDKKIPPSNAETCQAPSAATTQTPTGGSTSLPLGSLQQRVRAPQILTSGGPSTAPEVFSPRAFSKPAPSQSTSTTASGQSLSAPITQVQGQIDPLLRSSPRMNLPFMASVPMANGSHSAATSPLRGSFTYQATSPTRSQIMHVRRG